MPTGIPNSSIDFMFGLTPEYNNVPKLRKFYRKGHHFSFEKADITNNTEWFKIAKSKGWLPAMKAHRDATYPTFKWDNFDAWLEPKDPYHCPSGPLVVETISM